MDTPTPSHLHNLWEMLRDRTAPVLPKLLAVAAIFYIVIPVDFIPDIAPVIGWLDDLGIATVAFWWLMHVADRYAAQKLPPPQA